MSVTTANVEETVRVAAIAIRQGDADLRQHLDDLSAPLYVTRADGVVTYFNRACISLAGRTPQIGRDVWCVTWKLYTEEGEFLPHDQCPMALALRQKSMIRGVEAIAERPDGSRVDILPHPTPLFDDEGNLVGAVNLLLDVTGRKLGQRLRAEGSRCRGLANTISDPKTIAMLSDLAADYDATARETEQAV